MRFRYALLANLILLSACTRPSGSDPSATDVSGSPDIGVNLPALLDCAREQRVTLLQAHRAGDRPGAAENSIAAIRASLADGVLFMEIDVASSQDGVLILMHDDRLERTTSGSGVVAKTPYERLAQLTLVDAAGNDTGEPVPTLAEALDALAQRGIAQIDRKRSVTFDEIAAVLEENDAVGRSVIITYSIEEAIAVHRRLPEVIISTGIQSLDEVESLRSAGVDLSRITAWLGLGSGNPELDAALAARGIETSFGDFRAEREGVVDYRRMAANGAEVLSVDDVAAAAAALDAADQAAALMQFCVPGA
jgi:glycerophosphoryl diester phosphodiesterase